MVKTQCARNYNKIPEIISFQTGKVFSQGSADPVDLDLWQGSSSWQGVCGRAASLYGEKEVEEKETDIP